MRSSTGSAGRGVLTDKRRVTVLHLCCCQSGVKQTRAVVGYVGVGGRRPAALKADASVYRAPAFFVLLIFYGGPQSAGDLQSNVISF